MTSPAAEAPPVIALKAVGSYHVGGRLHVLDKLPVESVRLAYGAAPRAVDPNGTHISGQMYVQYFLQHRARSRWPVVLWHGGGMTGATWESTPDGGPGWLQRLLALGHDVYVCDAVERGRAGWSRWPEIYATPPLHRSLEEGWDMFRIGPGTFARRASADVTADRDTQFPSEHFESFAAQWVPRWAGHEELTLSAYEALLARIGPCVVVAHSQGGGLALEMALRQPSAMKAVVALEPSGAPTRKPHAAQDLPRLVVWGDRVAEHTVWSEYRKQVDRHLASLTEHGIDARAIDLPARGIRGNSHFPMLDRNQEQVLDIVLQWLDQQISFNFKENHS